MIMIFPDRDKMHGDYDKAHRLTLSIGKQSDGCRRIIVIQI